MFEAQLVSPERVLYTGQATQVLCRTVGGGDIAFLTDHAPMIGALDIWAVKITTTDNHERWFAVHGGFVEVSGDSVIILSDVAEAADQIDTERARRARDRVESELRSDPDSDELKAALQRADVRLEVAAK
ncbi:MAG TPA: ATP synthase F1 subunit epsilon [Acidimicrobiales bacterium]|nr:ATP synthase F1 subunit epsilon [Acidimicrobiales bacterium]